MKSLDPRINRLAENSYPGSGLPKSALDQFATYEVFVQPKAGKPFQHEGIVHAPNLEMAYVLAKEAFTRRFVCTSLYVVETKLVFVSRMLEGNASVYDTVETLPDSGERKVAYEIYHLTKRGKQHVHAGAVQAGSATEALSRAKEKFHSITGICNVWAIPTSAIRFTHADEADLWNTLPDKKFRDASEYKGGDKLKLFLESRNQNQESR
jgi:ring-1,2-phenylacetyl-CoA epoxidase subunit PaaB